MGMLGDMYRRKSAREDRAEWAAAMPGLMGEAPGREMMGPPEVGGGGGFESAGYGLMQDPGNVSNQMDFASGLMGLPGGQELGTRGIFDMLGREDQQAANIQSAAQGHQDDLAMQADKSTRDMFADQWGAGQQMVRQNMANLAQGVRPGFKDLPQYLTQERQLRQEIRTALTPYRVPLEKMNNVLQRLGEVGGDLSALNGTDDTTMMTTMLRLVNPNEAINIDDSQRTQDALQGFPGAIGMVRAYLAGDGALSVPQRRQLLETMGPLARNAEESYRQVRAPYDEAANRFDRDKVIRPPYELQNDNPTVRGLMGYPGGIQPATAEDLQNLPAGNDLETEWQEGAEYEFKVIDGQMMRRQIN